MFTTESRSDRARAGRWAVTRCAGARTPLPDTSTVTTGETGVIQCFTLHALLTQTLSTVGQVRSGQSVSRAHSAVVAHACHGHRYRPAFACSSVRGWWVQWSMSSPTGIDSRWRVVLGVMEFGMSHRIKPKEKYVHISMKEILAQFRRSVER